MTGDFWATNWRPNGVPVKIDKYYRSNVKNFVDDAIKDTFREIFNAKEDHVLGDLINFGQFICVVVALYAYLCEKLYKYPSYHEALFKAVLLYYIIYGISIGLQYFVLGDRILKCHEPEASGLDKGFIWNVRSQFDSLTAQFTVVLECTNLTNNRHITESIKKNIGSWINTSGEILCRKICKDLTAAHDKILTKM